MAYDEGLAFRLRELFEAEAGLEEKKMFGGLCFLLGGHMTFGIVGEELMIRVGPDAYAECLRMPHAREMDFTGRALKGMVYVSTDGFAEDEDLRAWAERGLSFARSLPPKASSGSKPRTGTGAAGGRRAARNKR